MNRRIVLEGFHIGAIFFWLMILLRSDAYYLSYFVIGIGGCVCCLLNFQSERKCKNSKIKMLSYAMSIIFSFLVVAANYRIFSELQMRDAIKILLVLFVCVCGFFPVWHILTFLADGMKFFTWKKCANREKPVHFFLICVLCCSAINLFFLFMAKYPGVLTPDSISQIGQASSGEYTNHHPFYHTLLIKLIMMFGYSMTGNINMAVAAYSIFQVILMGCCYSYMLVTLYQICLSAKIIIICALWYILMPFHIMYSFTIWKDVLFGGIVLVFLVSVFRCLLRIGNMKLNYFLVFFSGVAMCLFRSNGLFAYVLSILAFIILFWKKERRICICLFIAFLTATLLKFPVLRLLDISQTDIIESLSVPAQQIARVVTDCDDLTNEQEHLLNHIVDIDSISVTYTCYISDPIKRLIRQEDNLEYLQKHKSDFLVLYIDLGLKHPIKYLEAWIDQTRGYWNAGYSYWRWSDALIENEFGIERTTRSEIVNHFLNSYLNFFESNVVLQLFLCIGFYTWILVFLNYICIIRRNYLGFFMIIPLFAIIVSLLIATPVFAEFRYAYAIFCCIPFIFVATFYTKEGHGHGQSSSDNSLLQ